MSKPLSIPTEQGYYLRRASWCEVNLVRVVKVIDTSSKVPTCNLQVFEFNKHNMRYEFSIVLTEPTAKIYEWINVTDTVANFMST